MNAISVIMPCHNRARELPRVLDGYDRQDTDQPFEVIAVDDASTDDTFRVLSEYPPHAFSLSVERQPANRGPAAARNRAIPMAESPLLLFVGDDIVPEPDFIRRHIQIHRYLPDIGCAVLGRVTWPDDMLQNTLMAHIDGLGAQQFSYYYFQDGKQYDFRHFYTANISAKRELLFSVDHWFDTDFTYAAFEDTELAYRLVKHGLRILYSSAPVGRHYHYHTVWTFAARQHRAGMMACVFDRKHPGVMRRSSIAAARYWRGFGPLARAYLALKPEAAGAGDGLEAAALQLASFYEWKPNRLLDRLYVGVLDYFWRKGVVDGRINDPQVARPIHDYLARRMLAPVLAGFIREALPEGIALPEESTHSLLGRLP